MHVIQAIQERRAFRSLAPVKITKELVEEQLQKEKKRPGRKALEEFLYIDRFGSRS